MLPKAFTKDEIVSIKQGYQNTTPRRDLTVNDWASLDIGLKYDENKPRYDLIPKQPLEDIAKVLTFGAGKYSDDNWKKVESGRARYYSATIRHIEAWRAGEILDSEPALPHLAHAMATLMFLASGEFEDGTSLRHSQCSYASC